jgi:hypothetical protein
MSPSGPALRSALHFWALGEDGSPVIIGYSIFPSGIGAFGGLLLLGARLGPVDARALAGYLRRGSGRLHGDGYRGLILVNLGIVGAISAVRLGRRRSARWLCDESCNTPTA